MSETRGPRWYFISKEKLMDDGVLRARAVNLNDYEVIGVLEAAKIEVIDTDDI